MAFDTLEQILVGAFEAMRPAERLSVTEAAERYHIVRQPGAHNGPWSRKITPYLVEPQDILTSLDHTGMVFMGPARTGKSAMLINWLSHSAIVDPADMMVVHMARHTARDWVKTDLERAIRNSPELKSRQSTARDDDNIFDKTFRSGMRLTVTWPTINNLSGKTIPRHWLMDLDRMDDDIDGEGPAYDLTAKRGQTFKRFRMTVAESSPGKEVINPRWLPSTPHEAPPTNGITGLYNLGDRRRWYFACLHCREAFEGDFSTLKWQPSADLNEAAETAYMACPHCGGVMEASDKEELNSNARWVRDGMIWRPETGEIVARPGMTPAKSEIASFWLKGPAAGFQTWRELVLNWLKAEKAFAETGDEGKLRTTVNVDQGSPYISRSRLSERLPEELREKREDWGSTKGVPTVPPDVRFLIATVDVQARSFVVQVHGFTSAKDMVIVDYFKIRLSDRVDANGDRMPIEPATFAEDWHLLTREVLLRTYPLSDGSGARMPVKLMGFDSGGAAGATTHAYNYWRALRTAGDGLHQRAIPLKGNSAPTAPRAHVSWPDSNQTGKRAAAKGDVPVLMLGSNMLKDVIAGMINRRTSKDPTPGGMLRYPAWTEDFIFVQLTNEVRTIKGWENVAKRRNEAWDLAYYAYGIAIRPHDYYAPWPVIGIEKIDFAEPPSWADDWESNADIIRPEGAPSPSVPKAFSFRDLGAKHA